MRPVENIDIVDEETGGLRERICAWPPGLLAVPRLRITGVATKVEATRPSMGEIDEAGGL